MVTVSSRPTLVLVMRQRVEAEGRRGHVDAPHRGYVAAVGVLFEEAIDDGARHGVTLLGSHARRAVRRHPFADIAQLFAFDRVQQQLTAYRDRTVRWQAPRRE